MTFMLPSFMQNYVSGGYRATLPPAMMAPDGRIYITSQVVGFDITNAVAYRLLSTAPMVVEVQVADGVWATPPSGPTPTSVGANELVVIKGRWSGIRCQTTGTVTFITDYALPTPTT